MSHHRQGYSMLGICQKIQDNFYERFLILKKGSKLGNEGAKTALDSDDGID
jgi:hypothetical protein